MIPADIKKRHVLDAMKRLDKVIDAGRRRSRSLCLVHRSRHYPPRLVVSVASRLAGSGEVRFSGGSEAGLFLRRLGFDVRPCTCGGSRMR